MIYSNNLGCLQKKHQNIFSVIKAEDFSWDMGKASVLDTRNGGKTVVYNNTYLNSRYNPQVEAEKYMEEVKDMREKAILTLFGLANGDFLRTALEYTNKEVYIVVYEPSIDIFMTAINNIDMTDILSEDRVCLVVEGINEQLYEVVMGRVVQKYNKSTNKHLILPKYAELFCEAYDSFARKTEEAYERLNISTNTVVDFGKKVCKNDFMNLQYLPGCRSGMDLVGAFPEEVPAIVVSAGPSLAKNKHLLTELKGKALIVVVDTAIPQVMELGIKPDMIITVDPGKPINHFKDKGLSDVPFIIDMDSNYEVLEYVKPENMIVGSAESGFWIDMFNKAGSSIVGIEIGGSVATAAIANLIHWGLKRIILIGQDLTFTGGVTHIGLEKQEFDFSTGNYAYVPGIDGEQLITRKDYLTYIRWIENMAYRFSGIEFIDATEGGALIANTKVMTFREAIDAYCTKEIDVAAVIEKAPRLFVGEEKSIITKSLQEMRLNIRNMKKQMSQASLEAHRGSVLLSRGDYNVKELKRINAYMQKMDDIILASNERSIFERIMPEAEIEFESDMYETETDDIKESIRMYNKLEKYYGAISESCPKIIELIDQALEQLED